MTTEKSVWWWGRKRFRDWKQHVYKASPRKCIEHTMRDPKTKETVAGIDLITQLNERGEVGSKVRNISNHKWRTVFYLIMLVNCLTIVHWSVTADTGCPGFVCVIHYVRLRFTEVQTVFLFILIMVYWLISRFHKLINYLTISTRCFRDPPTSCIYV